MSDPVVIRPGGGRSLDVFGARLVVKATSRETGGAYSLIEGVFRPDGFAPLAHVHPEHVESFYVVEGSIDFTVGDEVVRGEVGSFLTVPGGVWHRFTNAGDDDARLLIIHSPAMEGFFLEMAELAAAGPPDPATLGALMRRWGMEVDAPEN